MDSNRPCVQVNEGRLIGIVEKNAYGGDYFAFRGIPYAKPPIGELRFRDPEPPEAWRGDRDASKYGNIAVQFSFVKKQIMGDEDCLFLNVYTTDLKPAKKRPVMVWIHGGGFFSGDGDSTLYGPDHIVRKDVVLVTINYRLGIFGFLNLKNELATGNQGLKDVVMALRWVQKNISTFGGDCENVTIFGESAGGATVHYLAISPFAEGLFHKAIAESGIALNPWAFTEWTEKGVEMAKKLGNTTSDLRATSEFLKTIEARKLVEFERKLYTDLELRQATLHFSPSMDTESPNPFLPEHPRTLAQRGVKVPFMLGFTSNEGSFLIYSNFYGDVSKKTLKQIDDDFKKAIHPRLLCTLPQIPITVEELRYKYFGNKPVTEETIIKYAHFLSDAIFHRGILKVADIQANLNNTTYLYQFAYESEKSLLRKITEVKVLPGASHIEELGYIFYPHLIKEMNLQQYPSHSEEYKMVEYLTQLWTDFAKTGEPTPATTSVTPVKWTPLKKGDTYDYIHIDSVPKMKTFCKGKERWDW